MQATSTICAIATPAGGALGVIRLSGPKAIACAESIFTPQHGKQISLRKSGTLAFGTINDTDGNIVDEVLISIFRAPHSYTGEDCIEISCHGSAYIMQRIIQLLLTAGCTMASPGEYTKRAFLNGKMDLSRAEAVADLIASTCEANHRIAMRQMRGGFSRELNELRERLLHITSLLELELDFSDHEDLEFADRTELLSLAKEIETHISTLCSSFRVGNAIKNGVPTAIVGETNAGKSTILNALIGEERALVSNIHGTTRDTIEELITIGGTSIRLIDTAGIRTTDDTVEQMGIQRSHDKLKEAEFIIWVIDATAPLPFPNNPTTTSIVENSKGKQIIVVLNKTDLLSNEKLNSKKEALSSHLSNAFKESAAQSLQFLCISAHNPHDIQQLRFALTASVEQFQSTTPQSSTLVCNLRHYEALQSALDSINRVSEGLTSSLSGDLISQDLRECIFHLSDIAGEVTPDAVLANIFSHFCVGK